MRLPALFFLIPFLNFLPEKASAQAQVEVHVALDSTKMLIGDQRKLTVTAQSTTLFHPKMVLMQQMDTTGKIEFLSESAWKPYGKNAFEKEILLTAFDSGYYTLLPLPVVVEQNGATDTFFTGDLLLMVNNPPIDTPKLEDIKPIFEEPTTWEDYLPYVYWTAGLAFAGLLIWLLSRKRKPAPVVVSSPVVQRPAHDIALEKLAALRQMQLWQNGNLKGYYSELTFILREYIEAHFGIPALESTTDEILDSFSHQPLSESLEMQLRQTLQTADLVKFAKAEPPSSEHDRWLGMAEGFVKLTQLNWNADKTDSN